MKIDLHTHTCMSDGELTPRELLEHATAAEIKLLAITDHDTIKAYTDLDETEWPGLRLISGVELSTHWGNAGIHVVGLNFRLDADAIHSAVEAQALARETRAERIAEKMKAMGLDDPMPRVRELAGQGIIGRPHFARFLVEAGEVKSSAKAFKKYLGRGKKCNINIETIDLQTAVGWIRDAGGTAVLAHPAKYGLSRTKLTELVRSFSKAGGEALEVISGNQPSDLSAEFAALCTSEGLLASCGSDFHVPGQSWSALGRLPALPHGCVPVWDRW